MNNKGFTLVELLAVIVILALIVGISFASVMAVFKNAKKKTEGVFVDTIKDAMEVYLSSDAIRLSGFDVVRDASGKQCYIKKRNGYNQNNQLQYQNVIVYKTTISMNEIINSSLKPLTESDLVNPANEKVDCANPNDISIDIYKDADYVYYYSIDKSEFDCLNDVSVEVALEDGSKVIKPVYIDNLPGEFICE